MTPEQLTEAIHDLQTIARINGKEFSKLNRQIRMLKIIIAGLRKNVEDLEAKVAEGGR